MTKHSNSGHCDHCRGIMNRYPGFSAELDTWFSALQAKHPEAHISCAGRGRQDQEEAAARGASRAHFGASAHNYNCAIDVFKNQGSDIYDRSWFEIIVKPALEEHNKKGEAVLEWYGAPGAQFPELPHIEIKAWRELRDGGSICLVEE